MTGPGVLSALESCPAEIVIDASVQDCFGNAADTVSQGTSASVLALDTTPPEVAASDSDLACLWPPNHRYVCLDAGDFDPVIADNCAANPTWEFAACSSDQPDNALGDGNTIDDCVLDADGQGFCARSERAGRIAGRIADGRRYDLDIRATDSCGNVSTSTEIGNVYVPRARSQALMCLAPAVP